MDFNEYQKKALTTDFFKNNPSEVKVTDIDFMSKVLGLVGESGEVAEKFKKILRNNRGQMNQEERDAIIKELGDVLWYIAVLSAYLGEDFETVGKINLAKLADRKERQVIASHGDDR